MAELVTVRRYLDLVDAELARAQLGACDVRAFVVEATGFNPGLSGVAGGVRLDVSELDLERAEEILGAPSADADGAGDAGDAAEGIQTYRVHGTALTTGRDAALVRCPRCELEYCFFERQRFAGSATGVTGLAILFYPLVFLTRKRWRCHKCEHVWDDPKAGPTELTRLEPDEPQPVFRLRRSSPGMGLFLGTAAAGLAWLLLGALLGGAGAVLFVVGPVAGWLLGGALGHDVCSGPGCRAPLPAKAEECPRCKGTIAGSVRRATEHFPAAAEARRAIAAHRESPLLLEEQARPRKKKTKKTRPPT